ncbi:bifunctional tRNA (adenosine(37)-C2)-methyltransferase TrmG/ribosomal RNA large subunit methyltransferase RlmN [Enterobacterales bacterium endosymbiont of Anomoneura mori]
MNYIYNFYINDLNLINNINKKILNKIKKILNIKNIKIYKIIYSNDGTIKFIMKIDKQRIETIYIPEKYRATLCISSQIGCFVGCKFCLTGKQGFNRNLYISEIISQILNVKKIIKKKKLKNITNIVFMGMGEPLLNFKNVVSSILIIVDKYCLNFSKYRITLSTVGIIPALKKLKNIIDINLALSLHFTNNKIRNNLIPINNKYNIKNILKASKEYINNSKVNKNGLTIEYVMLKNVNDNTKDVYKLISILKNIPCKINLIPFNNFLKSKFICSTKKKINTFFKILKKNGFIVTIRKKRGNDINASCGQLSGKILNRIN